ncbi:MAG: CinA family protein [Alphaproteobacteria bacterium]|jgi:nicotinamide-nucleotide amidase|nr:CinA family protein [Alphaproteobacteria bacterium]
MFDPAVLKLAETVLAEARAKGLKIATAESCTGGLVGGALTEIAGSSDVFVEGFITYSNEAKMATLGVIVDTLDKFGAVSAPTAVAMAEGAIANSRADRTVAITGVAGPGGGTAAKPVGLVHFAAARRGGKTEFEHKNFGDIGRAQVRMAAVVHALELLRRVL